MPPGRDCIPLNHTRHTAHGFDSLSPVVCAALRIPSGYVICSARHFDPLMREQIAAHAYGPEVWKTAEQGFINARGQFLAREDALQVAKAHGQIKRRCGGDERQLFSENLY